MLNSGAAEARFLMLASSKVYVIAAWQLGMLRWSGWPGPFFNSCQLPCPGTPPTALPPLAGISFYRTLPPAAGRLTQQTGDDLLSKNASYLPQAPACCAT